MSKVHIDPTNFICTKDNSWKYGYRIYTDTGLTAFDDTLKAIPTWDMDLLRLVTQSEDARVLDILSEVAYAEKGIYIGPMWYDWDKVKEILG